MRVKRVPVRASAHLKRIANDADGVQRKVASMKIDYGYEISEEPIRAYPEIAEIEAFKNKELQFPGRTGFSGD